MMTSHCSKLMENLRTEISIAMLCIFNTLDAILSVREDDVLLHLLKTNTVKSAHSVTSIKQ